MFVGEAPGRGRGHPGHPVRRARRTAADEDHRGDRAHARRCLHRQRHQVPPAAEPEPGAGRGRDLRTVPLSTDRHHQAEGDRRPGHIRGADAAADARSDLTASRPRLRVPRREAHSHVPSRLPAQKPGVQARGVGGHEDSPESFWKLKLKLKPASRANFVPFAAFAFSSLLIHVAVPVPTLDLLTYRVPADVAAPAVGARVVVPLGSRVVTGIVVDVGVSAAGRRRIGDQADPAAARLGIVRPARRRGTGPMDRRVLRRRRRGDDHRACCRPRREENGRAGTRRSAWLRLRQRDWKPSPIAPEPRRVKRTPARRQQVN